MNNETMKAFVIERYGNKPMTLKEMPLPVIGDHDVLIEIYAASVNPVDFKLRDGQLKLLVQFDMPLIMGNECSGVITQVGAKVTQFQIGDEVYTRTPKSRIGTFAQYVAVLEEAVALKPKNLSFEEAASIPLVGLTSYQVLHDVMSLKPNNKVLIHAGSGGVGTFAIQLAKTMGLFVATTASDKGTELVKSLGADQVINYQSEKFEDVLQDFDAVYDTLGGDALEKSFNVIKPGGDIVSVSGIPNARFAKSHNLGFIKTLLLSLLSKKITKLEKQHNAKYTFHLMSHSGQQLEKITALIEKGDIKPIVDKVYRFSEAQQALSYVESGRAKGKVVIKIK